MRAPKDIHKFKLRWPYLIVVKLKELGDELGARIGSQKGNGDIDYSARSVNNSTLQEISDV